MKKSLKTAVFAFSFASIILFNTKSIFANGAYLLYEKTISETLTKDVTYKEIRQVTNLGLRDIHVLQIPTKDPSIKVNNTLSAKEFEYKENLINILNENKAIAGVNGDFFNMKGTHSSVQGPVISEGNLIATDNLNNLHKNDYATFAITNDGNPIIEYLKTDIDFINAGAEYLKVHYYNKVPEMVYPVYIDQKAMKTTASVDAKFANVSKIVVEDNVVTYISKMGETVNVPENGYIILVAQESAEYQLSVVNVGDPAEIKINSIIDYDSLYTAIGGGGKLLYNGLAIEDGGFVPSGRQPRTAIGITQDSNYIILAVVDGRSHSIGASHYELASIMQRFGAYNAMHLDGGGSTTMGVKTTYDDRVKLVNTPSQGVMRNVPNGLGVYNNSEFGELAKIRIDFSSKNLIKGLGTPYEIVGLDEYLNKVPLDLSSFAITSTDSGGIFKDNMFYPSVSGKIELTATLNGMTASITVQSLDLTEIIPATNMIQTYIGQGVPLSFSGKSSDGINAYLYNGLNYEVVPADLGKVENNIFTASREGSGYIKVSVQNIIYYLDVFVGFKSSPLTSFETEPISYVSYPEGIIGKAYPTTVNVKNGARALALEYKFNVSNDTQAAYLQFNERIKLNGNPNKITLSVFGDKSNNLLKARLYDANGTEIIVPFTNDINWEGYQDLTAAIPITVNYPIYLDRIYVATLTNQDTAPHILFFDNLTGEIPAGSGTVNHPASSKFHDTKMVDLKTFAVPNSFDMTAIGDLSNGTGVKYGGYENYQAALVNAMSASTTKGLIVGDSDYEGTITAPILKWGRFYGSYEHNNVNVVYMHSKNGTFYNANWEQWQNFYKDIMAKGKKHIIIETDISPINLKVGKEFELFHELLTDLKKEGKNIFVVSTQGTSTTSTIKDGIRYINLGGLFKADNTLNQDVRVLRFRVSGDEIYYDLQKVF